MPISVMLKPASSNCNLRCSYCFYNSLSSQREKTSMGMMNSKTAENVIDSAVEFAGDSDIYFTFQGGEPLLRGLEFFESFVEYCKKNKPNGRFHFCLQTNGTLITDEYARFFKKNNFLIGVSLDGDESLNGYRTYPDGSSSFNDVLSGIKFLQKYNVSFNVLSVLTKRTADNFKKAYRFFKQNNLNYMQFIPCLRPFGYSGNDDFYMDSASYADFLRRCFNIYANDLMRGENISVRTFDNYILLARGENAEQCGMNGCCSTQFVVEGDGSTYPCDFYCTDDWILGNINSNSFEQMFKCEKSVKFLKQSFVLPQKCKDCQYFYLCRSGGCKRNRADYDYCDAYKKFFSESENKILMLKG